MNFRVQKYQNFQIQNVMLCVTINMIYVKKKKYNSWYKNKNSAWHIKNLGLQS